MSAAATSLALVRDLRSRRRRSEGKEGCSNIGGSLSAGHGDKIRSWRSQPLTSLLELGRDTSLALLGGGPVSTDIGNGGNWRGTSCLFCLLLWFVIKRGINLSPDFPGPPSHSLSLPPCRPDGHCTGLHCRVPLLQSQLLRRMA